MLSAIAATLAIVALGYVLKQRIFAGSRLAGALATVLLGAFPGLLFNLMSQADLGAVTLLPFVATIIGASIVIVGFALVAGRAIAMPGPSLSSLVQGALRHNGFLVLSVLQGTFGVAALQARRNCHCHSCPDIEHRLCHRHSCTQSPCRRART